MTPSSCTRVTSPEAIARAREAVGRIVGSVGEFDGLGGERLTGNLGRCGIGRRQSALVDPPPNGVVAHAEQACRVRDAIARHEAKLLRTCGTMTVDIPLVRFPRAYGRSARGVRD